MIAILKRLRTIMGTVLGLPVRSTLIDRSANVAQNTNTQLMTANTQRTYLYIQNLTGATMWLNFTSAAAATQPSISISNGAAFVMENNFLCTEAINVFQTVAGS